MALSSVIVRDFREEDVDIVYNMWRWGFYEMREDGFERLYSSRVLHIIMASSSFAILRYGFSLPSYISLVIPLSLIATDLYGLHSLYKKFLERLHGTLFWQIIGLVGSSDMKTSKGLISYWMKPNYSHFWVAEVQNKIVGCVACRLQHALIHPSSSQSNESFKTAEASIWRLTVDPSCRKLGIGRILMDHAEKWAVEHGADHMSLVTANRASALFYRRLGYTIESRERCEKYTYTEGTWKPGWVMEPMVRSRTDPVTGTLFVKKL